MIHLRELFLQAQPLGVLPHLKVIALATLSNGTFLISCESGRLYLLKPNQLNAVCASLKLQSPPVYALSGGHEDCMLFVLQCTALQ